jgi:hypothetical protein
MHVVPLTREHCSRMNLAAAWHRTTSSREVECTPLWGRLATNLQEFRGQLGHCFIFHQPTDGPTYDTLISPDQRRSFNTTGTTCHGPIPASLRWKRSLLILSRYGTLPGMMWLSMFVSRSQTRGLGRIGTNASYFPVNARPPNRRLRELASYSIKSQLNRSVYQHVFLRLEKSR